MNVGSNLSHHMLSCALDLGLSSVPSSGLKETWGRAMGQASLAKDGEGEAGHCAERKESQPEGMGWCHGLNVPPKACVFRNLKSIASVER